MKTKILQLISITVVLLFLLDSHGCISARVVQIKTVGNIYVNPSFSPTGDKILFQGDVSGKEKLFTCDIKGEDMKITINDSANYFNPKWGPDTNTILFISERNNQYDLFKYRIDSNIMVNLTNTPGFDENYASYTKDMTKLVYQQATRKLFKDFGYSYENFHYIISDTDGKNQRKFSDNTPVLSSDGLYFVTSKEIDRNTHEIWLYSLDGKTKRRITNGSNPITWTPNGRSILYNDLVDGHHIISFINIDGTGKKRLFEKYYYFNDVYNYNSWNLWDPTCCYVCLPITMEGGYMNHNGLVILDTLGNIIRDLRETNEVYDYRETISWSPDGKMITFSKNQGYPYPYQGGIYTINSDGTDLKIIIQDEVSYKQF